MEEIILEFPYERGVPIDKKFNMCFDLLNKLEKHGNIRKEVMSLQFILAFIQREIKNKTEENEQ